MGVRQGIGPRTGLTVQLIESMEARLLLSTAVPVRINAGGSAYKDSLGNSWTADQYFSGGSTTNFPYPVANTNDPALIYSRRWGNFSYNIPAVSGPYTLNLYFNESRDTAANQRLFSVSAEGSTILDHFDAFAASGLHTAITESFSVNVADGTLNLKFISIKDVALVSAIELIPQVVDSAPPVPLPSSWVDSDIGTVAHAGSVTIDGNGGFTVSGGGSDIFNSNDAFNFVYEPLDGDGTIVARVNSVQNTSSWAKAGVMIRENLTPSSRHAMIMLTPGNGASFQARSGTLSTPVWSTTSAHIGTWVELVRTGNTIKGFISADGSNWKAFGSAVLPFPNQVFMGLAVTAHDNSKLATAAFSNVSVTTTNTGSSIWNSAAPSPFTRFESSTFTVNDKVYVFGGFYNNATQATREADVYDPSNDSWKRLGDIPQALTHVGIVVMGSTVYFAGGYIGNWPHVTLSSAVYTYNVDDDSWGNIAPLPAGRSAGALVAIGDVLHYYGGVSNATTIADAGQHWSFDLDDPDAGWVTRAAMPNPRNHIGYATINGLAYAIGGLHGDNETGGNDSEVDAYDPDTDVWTKVASLPNVRSHFHNSTFVANGDIVIIGGETNGTGSSLADITVYDPTVNSWHLLALLPEARQAATAVLLDTGELIVVGGSIGPNNGDGWPQAETWTTDQLGLFPSSLSR